MVAILGIAIATSILGFNAFWKRSLQIQCMFLKLHGATQGRECICVEHTCRLYGQALRYQESGCGETKSEFE